VAGLDCLMRCPRQQYWSAGSATQLMSSLEPGNKLSGTSASPPRHFRTHQLSLATVRLRGESQSFCKRLNIIMTFQRRKVEIIS